MPRPPAESRGFRARLAAARRWIGDRVDDLGDRAGLHPGLIALAIRFPLTRPVARRRAGALFDLCAGFVYSQVLAACVELDLFRLLAAGPRSAAEVAAAVDLDEPAALRLIEAAASLRLARRTGGGRFRLGPLGRAVLLDPGIVAMVEHHAMLYGDIADPVALLRGRVERRALGAFWSYSGSGAGGGGDPARTRDYTRLMSASQAMVAREVVAAYPFRRHRRMIDVGGGDGTFLAAVAAAAPALDLTLFDLPPVAAAAAERFARDGLAARARAVGGDARCDALPDGADLVSLVRVLHDHDDPAVREILATVRRALPPGGTLLVAEPMAGAPGAERVGSAYFGFYLLAMGQGRARDAQELSALLVEAGFEDVRSIGTALPLVTGVMVARVPTAVARV